MRINLFIILCLMSYDISGQCIDPSKICDSCVCIDLWAPVCGCDGNIYSNICFAEINGILSWTGLNDTTVNLESCKGNKTKLGANGGTSYQWNTGAITDSIVVAPLADTTYEVTTTIEGKCPEKKDFNIKVNPVYIFNIDTTISLGDSVHVGNKFYTLPGNFHNTFSTQKGCDSISNIVIKLRDTCYFHVYDTIIIKDTVIFILVDSSVSMNAINNEKININIFPNPTNKYLSIKSNDRLIINYILYDNSGLIVKQENVNQNIFTFRLDSLVKGIYIIQIKLKNYGDITKKIIIQ